MNTNAEKLQSFGMAFRKAGDLRDFAERVRGGSFAPDAIWKKPDADVVAALPR